MNFSSIFSLFALTIAGMSTVLYAADDEANTVNENNLHGGRNMVEGIHCCRKPGSSSHTPGNDGTNCEFGPDNHGQKNPKYTCNATPEYALSHPNDPCTLAGTRGFCCPKSNSDQHIEYLFEGCD